MDRYDIAIIGTGPAGISAAITAKVRNKSVLLLGGSSVSDKVAKAHSIMNYPGLPAISGEAFRTALQDHLRRMDIPVTPDSINMVYPMGDYFALAGKGTAYEASTLILASGISFGQPYPGEQEFLGRGVSYCATCDAPLYRGKKVIIIAQTSAEEGEADFMAEICSEVLYFPLYKEDPHTCGKVTVVRDSPVSIEGAVKATSITAESGASYSADGIFILRESIAPDQLVPGLALDGRHVSVNRKMETNLPGCFACGDITGTPYQYIKAAGEGNVATLSAVAYLDTQKRAPAQL